MQQNSDVLWLPVFWWYLYICPSNQRFFSPNWVFPKIGVPQNGWFIMKNPIKMDDLGEKTIFSETSNLMHLKNLISFLSSGVFISFFNDLLVAKTAEAAEFVYCEALKHNITNTTPLKKRSNKQRFQRKPKTCWNLFFFVEFINSLKNIQKPPPITCEKTPSYGQPFGD